jgi:hypothetical protein
LPEIRWQCARCWQDSAEENRYDRQAHSGSVHFSPSVVKQESTAGGQQS